MNIGKQVISIVWALAIVAGVVLGFYFHTLHTVLESSDRYTGRPGEWATASFVTAAVLLGLAMVVAACGREETMA